MKKIQLTQGKVALVDDEDYEDLNKFKWFAWKGKLTFYARRNERQQDGKQKTIQMHSQIMKCPPGMEIDHRNHNGLKNQRSNLRIATRAQNMCNRTPRGHSKYLGVFKKQNGEIYSQIKTKGIIIRIGSFKTEVEAARAYDRKAKEIHGEFANLNFKP